jgi:hypothetical protein
LINEFGVRSRIFHHGATEFTENKSLKKRKKEYGCPQPPVFSLVTDNWSLITEKDPLGVKSMLSSLRISIIL